MKQSILLTLIVSIIAACIFLSCPGVNEPDPEPTGEPVADPTPAASPTTVPHPVQKYTLTIQNDGNGTTTPSGSTDVDASNPIESILAEPSSCYEFERWTVEDGDVAIDDPDAFSTDVTLNSDATIMAHFKTRRFPLTVSAGSGGTISAPGTSPVDVDCGVENTITAIPEEFYNFTEWVVITGEAEIADYYSASTTVVLNDGAVTIQAQFNLEYTLTIQNDGNGTTDPTGFIDVAGSDPVQSIQAMPASCYEFDQWTVEDGDVSIDDIYSPNMEITLNSDAVIRAHFERITYILITSADTGGTVSPAAGSSVEVDCGEEFNITAAPDALYEFQYWTVPIGEAVIADPYSATTTVILNNGNAMVQANFNQIGSYYNLIIAFDMQENHPYIWFMVEISDTGGNNYAFWDDYFVDVLPYYLLTDRDIYDEEGANQEIDIWCTDGEDETSLSIYITDELRTATYNLVIDEAFLGW